MKIFIDGPDYAHYGIVELLRWLDHTFHDVEVITGPGYNNEKLSRVRLFDLVNIIQSVDAAIFVLDPGSKSSKVDFDIVDWSDIILEYGMLMGSVSHKEMCIISTSTAIDQMPSVLRYIGRFVIGEERFTDNLERWIREIQPNRPSIITPSKDAHFVSLRTALSEINKHQREFNDMRVFALSTVNSTDLMMKFDFSIKKATILLREFTMVDEFLQTSMENTINESIELWKMMNKRNNISNIEILRFDFHPTNEFYIFDNRYVIIKTVYFDIKSGEYISETKDVILIDSSSESGKQFIDKCISHFDKLAEIYSDYTELEI